MPKEDPGVPGMSEGEEGTTVGVKVEFQGFAEMSAVCDVQEIGETLVLRRLIFTWEFRELMTFSPRHEEKLIESVRSMFRAGRQTKLKGTPDGSEKTEG
jgi:hypothetical protein